jgi:hypothetical protein
MALYLAIAVIVLAVFGPRWLRGEPGLFRVLAAVVWSAAALQSLGMLVNLLVIGPRGRRRRVYEVTNYRIIVTSSPRLGDAASVYLDQVDEPAVRRNRNGTDDVVLRAPAGAPVNRGLARLFQSAGLGLAAVDTVTRLEGVRDAEQARLVIAEARQRMRDGEIDVFSPPVRLDGPAPAGVIIAPDEDVLWTGRPARIPWWFGGYDIYLTAFTLVWVACVTCMAVWVARSGGAGLLVFLVPFGLVGGVYPAAGRVAHRRLLIMRSRYVLTSRRLIATWRPLRGTAPVVVQAGLGALLPPTVRGTSILTCLASGDSSRQRNGWRELTWPATTAAPPAVIGLANAQQVAELIGTAQIAIRAAVSK